MANNFTELAFTDSVRKMQKDYDTRDLYGRFEAKATTRNKLTSQEREFVANRDAFYMASVGENGWPYAQFRGGPQGLPKVIDDTSLGSADFLGTRQYISTANLQAGMRASLILMDDANQQRLKIWPAVDIL